MNHPKNANRKKSKKSFQIVHEDSSLLVIDKISGLLTVPIPGKHSRNLKDLVDRYLLNQKRKAFPAHRIDRFTSGLVVFAKSRQSWETLVAQFKAKSPERTYLAIVRGTMERDEGTLRNLLELSTDGFRQKVVLRGGTKAVTHYRVLERFKNGTFLEVRLETGLKNQIRIQFKAAGHPLVGDRHYTASEQKEISIARQALHAWKLGFIHPTTKKPVNFETPLPGDMRDVLERFRNAKGRIDE